MAVQVSIIIPTKNGEADIEKCLSAIYKQKTKYTYEVIIIDSGSTDNTLGIVSKFSARLIEIKPEEFGHGRTRNLGAEAAKGQYLVYLTQDAEPANDYWLEKLVENLEHDDKVAGAYSRWLPKANSNPVEAALILHEFGSAREVRELDEACLSTDITKLKHFSNASSSIRKVIWQHIPFDDRSIFGEDQEWAKIALESGYKIVYEPQSMIYHSSYHSFKERLKRGFDMGLAQQTSSDSPKSSSQLTQYIHRVYLSYTFMREQDFSLTKRIRWLTYMVAGSVISAVGLWLGQHQKYIPMRLKIRMSTVPQMLDSYQ